MSLSTACVYRGKKHQPTPFIFVDTIVKYNVMLITKTTFAFQTCMHIHLRLQTSSTVVFSYNYMHVRTFNHHKEISLNKDFILK